MSQKKPGWVGRARERRRQKENRDHVRWHEEQRDYWSERLNFLIEYLNRRLQAQDAETKKKQRWETVAAVSTCFAAIFSLASLGAFLFVSFKAEETARTSTEIAGYQLAEMKAEHRPWIALRGEVLNFCGLHGLNCLPIPPAMPISASHQTYAFYGPPRFR